MKINLSRDDNTASTRSDRTSARRKSDTRGVYARTYTWDVPVTVELSADLLARLHAEAARRGVSIDAVIAELAGQLPADATPANSSGSPRRTLSFAGTLSAEPSLAERAEDILDEIARRNAS